MTNEEFKKTGKVYIIKVTLSDKEGNKVGSVIEGAYNRSFTNLNWHSLVCGGWTNKYIMSKKLSHLMNQYWMGNVPSFEIYTYDKWANKTNTKFTLVSKESVDKSYNYYKDSEYLSKRG